MSRRAIWSGLLAGLFVLAPAVASHGEGCGGLFPDFSSSCHREARFHGFTPPVVQPYLFEDPFITSNLEAVYVWHEFPGRSALQGGDAQVAALQARVALTEDVAIIATKDGYMWLQPDNPLLDHQRGFMNLAGGVKVRIAGSQEREWMLSGILRFEFPSGAGDVFQGYSDPQILPSISGAYRLGPVKLMGDLGGIIPTDASELSSSLFYHLWAGVPVTERVVPFLQLSGQRWLTSGDGTLPVRLTNGATLSLNTVQAALGTGAFEGADVMNLGSKGVDNRDFLTLAAGVSFALADHLTLGMAYERPISTHKDITKQRVTANLVFEF